MTDREMMEALLAGKTLISRALGPRKSRKLSMFGDRLVDNIVPMNDGADANLFFGQGQYVEIAK